MRRIEAFVVLLLLAGVATAQTNGGPAAQGADQAPVINGPGLHDIGDPVAEVRNNRSWEYGPFLNWGSGVGSRSDYKFLWGGYELLKVISPVAMAHPRFLSGQFEYGGSIMPLWQAYTPPPHQVVITCVNSSGQVYSCPWGFGGGTFRGVSLEPVIFRWNFLTHARHIQPWFQAAGGLVYTTHKFPPNYFSDPALGIDGGTCVWNFSPQGGGGIHIFIKEKRSIDVNINGVHISSASLGDRNPGVNGSVQFQVGYTYWK